MKRAIITFTTVLLSLKTHADAVNPFTLQSGHSSFPDLTKQVTENNKPQPERTLQTDGEILCPVCGRFDATFGVPYPPDFPIPGYPGATCGMVSSNEYYDNQTYSDDIVLPKCHAHRDLLEEVCCNLTESPPLHECKGNVRSILFANYNTNYSTVIVPQPSRVAAVSVDTLVQYWAVSNLDLTHSKIEVFMDIQLSWNDPRLAWDVTSDKCATSMFVRASHDVEATDIWVPALDLLNREDSIQDLADSPAKLYSDGTVRWNRGGKLAAFCSFIGLRRMPFDTVGCQLLFGSNAQEFVTYNLVDLGDERKGLRFPAYNQTYAEYRVVQEKTTSRGWGAGFSIELFFERSRRHYISLVILPTILFVYISFGQFFFESGGVERVSFGINTLLIVVAQSIITSDMLPHCKETIWLNSITTSCQYFVLAGVFEALILYCLSAKRVPMKSIAGHTRNSIAKNSSVPHDHSVIPSAEEDIVAQMRVSKRIRLLSIMLWLDQWFMFLLPASFTVYLIIMFATNYRLDDDPNEVWVGTEF